MARESKTVSPLELYYTDTPSLHAASQVLEGMYPISDAHSYQTHVSSSHLSTNHFVFLNTCACTVTSVLLFDGPILPLAMFDVARQEDKTSN